MGGDGAFLIVRLGSLGDVIHGIPVAAALRDAFPRARVDWMVDPKYVEILGLVSGIDRIVPVDPRRMRGRLIATVRDLRASRYDAAIDLQGLIKSAVLARLAGARRTIGLPHEHLREPVARGFYTETPDPGPATHVVYRNLALLSALGVTGAQVRFPLMIPASRALDRVREMAGAGPYALINPGAAWPNKRWPPLRFGTLAAWLRDTMSLTSIVLWGPGEESLVSEVVAASAGAAMIAPPTTIADLFAVAKAARLMISGDTGPLHIAAAVGTPVVALFGPTRPERNGPWSAADITVSRVGECECLYERRCRRSTPCIDSIDVSDVIAAVGARLGAHG